MWYYYLALKEIREKIDQGVPIGVLSHGKVYRKDEIDRNHMNIFHQIDGLYLCKTEDHVITQEDLRNVLEEIAKSVFGQNIKFRFNDDTFPYTNQSIEMEIDKDGKWIEVLGAGVVQPGVLEKLGVDSTKYNGWAFGFGLERLAIISMELPDIRLLWSDDERVKKQLKLGNKFVEVSKYPPIVRDISFVVKNDFVVNDYFDLVRETAPNLIEEVSLLDKYENVEKFGKDMISYAYRITYRSTERTLLSEEVDSLHKKLENETSRVYGATVR
jgi:phenylalanyl-tRNA synthetase alpha chain